MKKQILILALSISSFMVSHAQTNDALYQALGQKQGLVVLMDDFGPRLLNDSRMKPFFEKTNQSQLKEGLVNQLCQLSGGPCAYKGPDMKTLHGEMDITKAHFNALVEVLQQSMDAQKIPFRTQNQLLALLAPMNRDIITIK